MELDRGELARWRKRHGVYPSPTGSVLPDLSRSSAITDWPADHSKRLYENDVIYQLDKARPITQYFNRTDEGESYKFRYHTIYRTADDRYLKYSRSVTRLKPGNLSLLIVMLGAGSGFAGYAAGLLVGMLSWLMGLNLFSVVVPGGIIIGALAPAAFAVGERLYFPVLRNQQLELIKPEAIKHDLKHKQIEAVSDEAIRVIFPDHEIIYRSDGPIRYLLKKDSTYAVVTSDGEVQYETSREHLKHYLVENHHDSVYQTLFGQLERPG